MILKTFDKMKKKISNEYVISYINSYVFQKPRTSTCFDFNVIYAIGQLLWTVSRQLILENDKN